MTSRAWSSPLVLIGVVTAAPFVLALLAYQGWFGSAPFSLLPNEDRELITPPLALPDEPLETLGGESLGADWARYRWSLIYARISPCEAQCAADLDRLQQVHAALGRDQDRVQRVFLTGDPRESSRRQSGLVAGRLEPRSSLSMLLGPERIAAGRVFVVDPLGNLVSSYPPDADRRRILEDLERLLDVSKVG
jgi:cytochrome oxidase Cu insertion factor (SCO1/SenC/PrrC family)